MLGTRGDIPVMAGGLTRPFCPTVWTLTFKARPREGTFQVERDWAPECPWMFKMADKKVSILINYVHIAIF